MSAPPPRQVLSSYLSANVDFPAQVGHARGHAVAAGSNCDGHAFAQPPEVTSLAVAARARPRADSACVVPRRPQRGPGPTATRGWPRVQLPCPASARPGSEVPGERGVFVLVF